MFGMSLSIRLALRAFCKVNNARSSSFRGCMVGIAKSMLGDAESTQSVAGTPFYMSPECLKGTGYNDKSDVWALACVLYELCMLRHPFKGDSLMSLMYNICEGVVEIDLPACYSDGLRNLVGRVGELIRAVLYQ